MSDHFAGEVKPLSFEEYSEKYKDFFVMKRENGIIEARMHTDGGPFQHTWAGHSSWSQAWQDIANDQENEVLIITGTGDKFYTIPYSKDPEKRKTAGNWEILPFREWSPDLMMRQYKESYKNLENLVFQMDIPTIAVVNGPGSHTEFALQCDLTLCATDAYFFENHFIFGVAPGDGMYLIMQELLGLKRAAYYMYTGENIDAETAKELGLVNEVLPREKLLDRAWEIAREMMKRPRGCRYMASQITKRPWKKILADALEHNMMHQHFDMAAERETGTSELRKYLPIKVPFTYLD